MDRNLVQFAKRKKGRKIRKKENPQRIAYDAASMEEHKFLNPFFFSEDFNIPVPGQVNKYSNTVEAIWQGLKIVDGETCFDMFGIQEPHKRPMTRARKEDPDFKYADSKFEYGGKELDLVTARKVIYVPTYRHLFEHYVPDEFKEQVKKQVEEGKEVFFYDWDDNPDLDNTEKSFAHASLLVELMNEYIADDEAKFDLDLLVQENPLNLPTEQRTNNYCGRLERYIEQLTKQHYEISDGSLMASIDGGAKKYSLSSGEKVTIATSDKDGNELYVTHESETPSELITDLKRLKTFFWDISWRDFKEIDLESQLNDYDSTATNIGELITQKFDVTESQNLFSDEYANIAYYRLNDGSYAFLVHEKWEGNNQFKLFLETGTLAENVEEQLPDYGPTANDC
jgi:hypothetical protein